MYDMIARPPLAFLRITYCLHGAFECRFPPPTPPPPFPSHPPCRKVKNSWGETWGLDGYILLERADSEETEGGECGLLIEAVYPILGSPAEDPTKGVTNEDLMADVPEADMVLEILEAARENERPLGFESSAIATDCGGGASDIVFGDGERGGATPRVLLCWPKSFVPP